MKNTERTLFFLVLVHVNLKANSQIVTNEIEVQNGDSTVISAAGEEKLKIKASGVEIERVLFSVDEHDRDYLGTNGGNFLWLGTRQASPDVILRGNSHMSVNTITSYDSHGMPNFKNGLISKGNIRIGENFGQRYIGTMDGSYLYFGVNGGGNLIIRSDGVTAGNFQNFSDRRMKSDFVSLARASELIQSISFYRYKNKLSGSIESGVIADELAGVIPHLVFGEANKVDNYGNEQYQSVNYNGLVAYLGAALQESLEKIADLEQRLEQLENR